MKSPTPRVVAAHCSLLALVASAGVLLAVWAVQAPVLEGAPEVPAATAGGADAAPVLVQSSADAAECARAPAAIAGPPLPAAEPTPPVLLVRVDAERESARRVDVVMTATAAGSAADVIATRRTDEAGEARFPPCAAPSADACLDFAFPTCGAYAQRIDAATRHATMFLPAVGLVRLRVVDAEGTPVTVPATAQVRVLDATPPAARTHVHALSEGQGCLFVEAAGLDLEVSVHTDDGRRSAPVRLRGPVQAGSACELSVRLPAPRLLRARLLGAAGRPLAGASVVVHLEGAGTRLAADLVADRTGGVAFRAPVASGSARYAGLLFSARAAGASWQGRTMAHLGQDGDADLGEVILCEPPALVTGVCVDRDGRPRRDLELRVQAAQPLQVDKSGRPGEVWRDLPVPAAQWQDDGSFRVFGFANAGQRLRLVAVGQGAQPLVFTAGALGVRLVLASRAGWPGAARR